MKSLSAGQPTPSARQLPTTARRRPELYLLPVALALLSNYFFTGEFFSRALETSGRVWGSSQIGGLLSLLAAIGAAFWCFGALDNFAPAPDSGEPREASRAIAFSRTERWLLVACGLPYLTALTIYWLMGENHLVHGCWGLSLITFLTALGRHFDARDFWPIPFWEYALVIILTAIAFTLRNIDLVDLPYHIDNDVSIMGLFSKKLIAENDWRWIGMAPTNHQFSEHQFHALSMRLFGQDHYGLVMLSVVAGTATVPLLYFLGKILFNRGVGLIAATFLTFNYVHIHFSRIVFGSVTTLFLVLAGLFLVHGIRRGRALSFALGGAAVGLGMLGYYSGRVGPLIAIGLFTTWWLQRKKTAAIPLSYWLLSFAGGALVFGPNLVYGLHEPEKFAGRGNDVVLWADPVWQHLSLKYNAQGSAWVVIKEQVKRTFLTPFYFPDASVIFYLRRPMLSVFASISLVLGLGFCLRRIRDFSLSYGLIWIGLTFIFGGVLTIDPPFWPHLNVAVPALALIGAVGVERFAARFMQSRLPRANILVPTLLTAALLATGLQNWEVYYAFASVSATGPVHAVRQIEKLPGEYRIFLVGNELKWSQETFQFLTPHVEGHNLTAEELFRLPPKIDKPTVFFVFEDADSKCVEFLAKIFPWSSRRLYRDTWQWPACTMVRVLPPGFVETPQVYYKPEKMFWDMPGGLGLSLSMIGAVFLGCILLNREFATTRSAEIP